MFTYVDNAAKDLFLVNITKVILLGAVETKLSHGFSALGT